MEWKILGTVFISVSDADKEAAVPVASMRRTAMSARPLPTWIVAASTAIASRPGCPPHHCGWAARADRGDGRPRSACRGR